MRTLGSYKTTGAIKSQRVRMGKTYLPGARNFREVFDYVGSQPIRTVEIVRPGPTFDIMRPELSGLSKFSVPSQRRLYSLSVGRGMPLATNVVILGGGETHFITWEVKSVDDPDPLYTKKVARVLANTENALEALLMLAYSGTLTVEELVEELIPRDKIVEVIAELRHCDLVQVSGNLISLTPQATRIIERIRMKLEDGNQP